MGTATTARTAVSSSLPRSHRALVGLGLAACALTYLASYRAPQLAALGPLRNLLATLAATVPYAVAVFLAERQRETSRGDLLLLFGGLLLLRLCVPWSILVGSDDAYRYLWDGWVQSQGINPYLYPPQAAELAGVRDETLFSGIFRPDMRTVYPPLAQLWFRLAHAITPGRFIALKGLLLAHELAACALLLRLLVRRGAPPMRALVYAWSPLAVTQLAAGAHLDGLLLPWLLLALLWAERRPLAAGAALGASTMIRPVTLLCAPSLLLRRPLGPALQALLGLLLVTGSLAAPFARAGHAALESLLIYAKHWRFNGSLFRLVDHLWHREEGFRRTLHLAIAGAAIGVGALPARLSSRFIVALGLYFAWAPTVYPWYLLPLVLLGALHGGPLPVLLPALIGLSDLVFVEGRIGGPWTVPPLALILEYVGIYGLLLYHWLRYRRRLTGEVE